MHLRLQVISAVEPQQLYGGQLGAGSRIRRRRRTVFVDNSGANMPIKSVPTIVDPPLSIDLDLRVHLGDQIAIGPGKARLLASIHRTGSISAAGREMGMSYKHAWLLVDSMNGCFRGALVEAVKGGKAGGGASLTSLGLEVLECYRQMQSLAAEAIRPEVSKFKRRIQES